MVVDGNDIPILTITIRRDSDKVVDQVSALFSGSLQSHSKSSSEA